MRKIIALFSLVILVFSLFGQQNTYAATDNYDDIKVGEYDIIAKAITADTDEESAAGGFIEEEVQLHVTEDEFELIFTIPNNEMATINSLEIEGSKVVQNGDQWSYKAKSIDQMLNADVQYEVPELDMKHDVSFRFSLEGLDDLPIQEKSDESEVEEPEEGDSEEGSEDSNNPENGSEDKEEPEEEKPEGDESNAEETPENEGDLFLENGYYTVETSYLHASKDEPSSMGRYLADEIYINVQDEIIEMTIAINDHDTVTKLQVDGKDPVQSKLDGNTRYDTFQIDHTEEPVDGYVEYQAPYGDSIHYGEASFRINMSLDNAEESTEQNQPGSNISAEYLNLTDGLYSIDASFINTKNGKESAMASYLGDKAYISIEDGVAEIFFLINDNGTVTKLKVNDTEGLEEIINGQETLQSFNVMPLLTEMKGYVEYEAPFGGSTHYGNAEFDIILKKSTLKEETELPLESEESKEDEEKEETKPGKPEQPSPNPEKPETPKEDKPKEGEKESAIKGYTIDYVIKHAIEDEASAADNFFVKPGTLLKKDGKNYLQVTVNNWSMIDWIKVNGKSISIIDEDTSKDTAIIQFEVPKDLNEIVQLSMKVTVPGLYETEHDARLVMDADSLEEDKSDNDYVIKKPSSDETESNDEEQKSAEKDSNGENGATTGTNNNTPDRPAFGGKEANAEKLASESKANGQTNPKTGDSSKIILYSLLFLGSLSLLVMRYRKYQLSE